MHSSQSSYLAPHVQSPTAAAAFSEAACMSGRGARSSTRPCSRLDIHAAPAPGDKASEMGVPFGARNPYAWYSRRAATLSACTCVYMNPAPQDAATSLDASNMAEALPRLRAPASTATLSMYTYSSPSPTHAPFTCEQQGPSRTETSRHPTNPLSGILAIRHRHRRLGPEGRLVRSRSARRSRCANSRRNVATKRGGKGSACLASRSS
mmetsp:Transcript_3043/g.12625  ORF Transcript_3043/g.12625 Transcript_3043/m.12625 type:complete len:208 (+) Transcript_3043:249-872(+)